jgi:hypothetical protein
VISFFYFLRLPVNSIEILLGLKVNEGDCRSGRVEAAAANAHILLLDAKFCLRDDD